ncbi:MAG TPA: OmpA family protein, partial [Puia sp.]|nr:OmpA family protein [Puia sp.]
LGALTHSTQAQQVGDVLKQQAGEGVKQGAAVATEQTATNATNKLLNKLFTKKGKPTKADSAKAAVASSSGGAPSGTVTGPAGGPTTPGGQTTAASGGAPPSLTTYSKFDFVPGDKILSVEDFTADAIGDFPEKWNTNSTGEIQTISGREGKWLSLTKNGVFLPEFITNLPDNFTLQFDLLCSDNFSYYSGAFQVSFAVLPNPAKQFTTIGRSAPRTTVDLSFHPQDAHGNSGHTNFWIFSDDQQIMKNDETEMQFATRDPGHRLVRISIWRQKQRIRVYMNQEKVWDLPRSFEADKIYNTVLFSVPDELKSGDRYLFSNIRLAAGAPDTRNKLITEGKFSTTGILFDVNSSVVRPESYGSLKDLADVLKDNNSVRVKIIGHTDSDGDATANLALSKKRAEAVKDALAKEFAIDPARLDTDGKGAGQPIGSNTTPAGKAQNRRVEFIRL